MKGKDLLLFHLEPQMCWRDGFADLSAYNELV